MRDPYELELIARFNRLEAVACASEWRKRHGWWRGYYRRQALRALSDMKFYRSRMK